MNRLLAFVVIALVAVGAPAFVLGANAGSSSRTLTVNVGDIVRVSGAADIGCRVIRHDGFRTLDCRRAGPLAGTYGIMLNKREVLVVRFRNATSAKIVVVAKHGNPDVQLCT
jgi:hypothetical protein